MSKIAAAILIACLCASRASADDGSISQCIERGVKFLKTRHSNAQDYNGGSYQIGSAALVGLALLESRVPVDDAAIKTITAYVRANALSQAKTYEMSLTIMYLDRLGDPVDRPVIQLLAVQVMAGQHALGCWGYASRFAQSDAEAIRLRKLFYAAEKQPEKDGAAAEIHPEVARYAKAIEADVAVERKKGGVEGLDNSNTQFAVIALWIARRHGIECGDALTLAEKRFRATQLRDGGWSYNAGEALPSSLGSMPPMTCSGLLGLAAGRGIRMTVLHSKSKPADKSNPFGDGAIAAGFKYLERAIANSRGPVTSMGASDLRDNLYFLWCVERVATIYDVESIGAINWFKWGADRLIKSQRDNGSWEQKEYHGANPEINTAFALLFLNRANLARDLTATLKGTAKINLPDRKTDPEPVKVDPKQKNPGSTEFDAEANRLSAELVKAAATTRPTIIAKLRDTKGSVYTEALVRAIAKLQGEQQREAREALALRLKRMTVLTLREMLKDENREIRNAAASACGLKDDKQFVGDLISVLNDAEPLVVQSARNSLCNLSGKDFGPQSDANAADKAKSIADWKAWLVSQPK